MEINRYLHIAHARRTLFIAVIAFLFVTDLAAQPWHASYTVKNNKMFVSVGKQMGDASIDSFTLQFNLRDLNLKRYIRGVFLDSLRILGWNIETNNNEVFVISKPLYSPADIDDPVNRIDYTQKGQTFAERFPVVSDGIRYGVNNFRNKSPFAIVDSFVTFFLRGHTNAKRVMLAGSFNDWKPDALAMNKTDSGWIATVKLRPGKYWYKFIADGRWMTDSDNRTTENDGQGNMNSVYFKTNVVLALSGYQNAGKVYVSGSFNYWSPSGLPMHKTPVGWSLPLYLAEGTHTYRFVADGKWFADPANPQKLPNEYGEYNSVLRRGKPYQFQLNGYTEAKKVMLSGSFNNWRRDELMMTKTGKGWELPYTLGPGNYEYYFIIDDKKELRQAGTDGTESNFHFVIQPNYTFRLKGYDHARKVYLAGDFNNWSPNTFLMKKEGNEWVLPVYLAAGKHLYKFVVDGTWIRDPDNKLWEQNKEKTGNSIIWIAK